MPRQKKYKQLADLSKLNLDMIEKLEDNTAYVERTYTVTTSGGKNILWEVNNKKDDQFITISTGSLRRVRTRSGYSYPLFRHYVLSPEGKRFIKSLVIETAV